MANFISLKELFNAFDAFIIDQWGVLHNGKVLYDGVKEFFELARDMGKPIVILSNSGKPSQINAERIAKLGIDQTMYSFFMTSGEAVSEYLSKESAYKSCYLMSRGGDKSILAKNPSISCVDTVEKADFVLLSGLDMHDNNLESFRPFLEKLLEHNIPMVCANPDKVAIAEEGEFYVAAGAVAEMYRDMGGRVTFFGKPYAEIYDYCFPYFDNIDLEKILMIGDSLHHDILGGQRAGVQTLLIGEGLLSKELDIKKGNVSLSIESQLERVHEISTQEGISPDYYRPFLGKDMG